MLRSRLVRPFTRLLLLCSVLLLACTKAVVIAEYPVDDEQLTIRAGRGAERSEGYWSAYVRVENQDIPYLWKTNDLDYALISIEVTIPTRKGPLVRTIPLFTLEHGVPQAESGVDLLKKIPLTREAREQVSFRLQVTYLKNKRALDTSRKILDRVANLAKPFLANYPVASQIIETSLGLIDDSVDSSEGAASSMVTVIDVDSVVEQAQRSRDGSSMLQAYFLIPVDLRLYRGRGKDVNGDGGEDGDDDAQQCRDSGRVEYCGVKSWLDKQIGDHYIVECSDFRGRLCLIPTDRSSGLDQRVKNEQEDLDALLDQQVGDVSRWFMPVAEDLDLAEFVEWVMVGEDRSIRYQDIPQSALTKLEEVVTGLDKFSKDHAHCWGATLEAPAPADAMSCDEAEDIYANAIDRLQDLVHVTLDETEEIVGLKQAIEEQANVGRVKYRDARLDSIVYVTIRFERYDEVYDPLALIPGSRTDCGAITPDSIDEAQEYFSANVDFFREGDADKIRQLLRGAREYLLIKDLVEKGSHIEAARALGKADALRRIRAQMGDSSRDAILDTHVSSIATCFRELERRPPLRQLASLWRVYLSKAEAPSPPSPWLERKACAQSPSAQRLDQITLALEEFSTAIADPTGVSLRETSPGVGEITIGDKSKDFDVAALLLNEADELHDQQLQRLLALAGNCDDSVAALLNFSAACTACFTQFASTCKADKQQRDKVFAAQATARSCARSLLAP